MDDMMFNTPTNQLICIYAGETSFTKQLDVYLKSLEKKVLSIDITKTMPTDTQWHDIAIRLGVSLKDLMHSNWIKEFNATTDYSEESLVKILANNPEALKGAIVMEENRIEHITSYNEILKFTGVDSAGLEKTPYTDDPTTSNQTKDDTFI
ncbi:hypothetical protein AB9K26_09305 [Psychroserpens sp. XS_ASV72]|uniref:hypothetical protein n=1 Tax=Psychroserpens sp. XS_ASV72 TaxID=3241293 RepID=UPI0035127A9C